MITPRAPRVQDSSEDTSTGVAGYLLKGVKDAGR